MADETYVLGHHLPSLLFKAYAPRLSETGSWGKLAVLLFIHQNIVLSSLVHALIIILAGSVMHCMHAISPICSGRVTVKLYLHPSAQIPSLQYFSALEASNPILVPPSGKIHPDYEYSVPLKCKSSSSFLLLGFPKRHCRSKPHWATFCFISPVLEQSHCANARNIIAGTSVNFQGIV